MNRLKDRLWRILPLVSRPARYLGNELNLIRKDHSAIDLKIALAFPDVYEIGQSYLGFHILYHIINKRSDALAERVFAPWVDLEELMRKHKIPLFSLESTAPLSDFDIIGFTLQYELNYTNILNMLDLSGLPVMAAERDESHPLVLAGGACAFNPEPLAYFIDAFVIGDGEEVIDEIIDSVKEGKRKELGRREILRGLAEIEGIYVPSFYSDEYDPSGEFLGTFPIEDGVPPLIRSRFIPELLGENYPHEPLVPLTEIIHDRLSIEVMRGCTRGCRFCGAGMAYRPLRERPADDVVEQAVRGIASSGWDEVSLVSLSTSDYSYLDDVTERLNSILAERRVALSLPSMRPEAFSLKLAESLKNVRKTGLTFAPEAGTERLRSVINKDYSEEDMLEAVRIAYSSGWNLIKLYFMIGLPTESQEDLGSIVDLIRKASAIGRREGGGKRLNVTISPFSPKPNTPFQWDGQDDLEVLREKIGYLRRKIPSRGINLKWRNPEVSTVEAAFARGDRRFSKALLNAWRSGVKFDGWSEFFDFKRWEEAFRQSSIDLRSSVKARDLDAPLPWDHIQVGVKKEFLLEERRRASQGRATEDCRQFACAGCGVGIKVCEDIKSRVNSAGAPRMRAPTRGTAFGRRRRRVAPAYQMVGTKVRVEYSKRGKAKFLSHLDLVRIFDRSLRRAGIPIAYSQGYHPHPKIAFGPSLPLGIEGLREYVDLQFSIPPSGDLKRMLRSALPPGFEVLRLRPIFGKTQSLSAAINLAEYEAKADFAPGLDEAIERLLKSEKLIVRREKGKEVDIRPAIEELSVTEQDGSGVRMLLRMEEDKNARPREVIEHLLDWPQEEILSAEIVRTGLFIDRDGEILTPMEVI